MATMVSALGVGVGSLIDGLIGRLEDVRLARVVDHLRVSLVYAFLGEHARH
jgi:hypothetical protein